MEMRKMIRESNLKTAVSILKEKCGVIPEKYFMYNGDFMFLAYPPNAVDKEQYISVYYLVNVKRKIAGPFSPAFDITGFFKAAENMKNL